MRKIMHEVFVPLYIKNTCDSQCKICNLRKSNKKIKRIEGSSEKVKEQLNILYKKEMIKEVCFLTGEYYNKNTRERNIIDVIQYIKIAFEIGFQKVFINIGSLTDSEIQLFADEFSNKNNIVLSLFQETYDKKVYKNFFVSNEDKNPKANFQQRLTTPARWIASGFSSVDIGILLGLHKDFREDIIALVEHANMLHKRGAEVYISLPRIRGTNIPDSNITDRQFIEVVKEIGIRCSWAKIILTTRENLQMLKILKPYVQVISPGSSDVLPYTNKGKIENSIHTSQFVVKPLRDRPSEVLKALGIEQERLTIKSQDQKEKK